MPEKKTEKKIKNKELFTMNKALRKSIISKKSEANLVTRPPLRWMNYWNAMLLCSLAANLVRRQRMPFSLPLPKPIWSVKRRPERPTDEKRSKSVL